MFCKRMYIAVVVCLAISGSILTWMLLYGNFPHNAPVRAKQVFKIGAKVDSSLLASKFFSKYNTVNNAQTMYEARSFY